MLLYHIKFHAGQGHWKWYKMAEVNCAYKYGSYEKKDKFLHIMSSVKVFACERAGWLAGETQLIT